MPGEKAVLDAQDIGSGPIIKGRLNEGAFQVQGVSYVRVANLTIINSHDAGITVRDASDIEIINNTTVGNFFVWHGGLGYKITMIRGRSAFVWQETLFPAQRLGT